MHRLRMLSAGAITVGLLAVFLTWTLSKPGMVGNSVMINMTASIVKKTPDGKYTGGWNPKRITAIEGDEVVIRIKSLDVEHVFSLEAYNIDKDVQPGDPVEVRFVADKVGIFYYHCGIECGPLHKDMVGQLIVNKKT